VIISVYDSCAILAFGCIIVRMLASRIPIYHKHTHSDTNMEQLKACANFAAHASSVYVMVTMTATFLSVCIWVCQSFVPSFYSHKLFHIFIY